TRRSSERALPVLGASFAWTIDLLLGATLPRSAGVAASARDVGPDDISAPRYVDVHAPPTRVRRRLDRPRRPLPGARRLGQPPPRARLRAPAAVGRSRGAGARRGRSPVARQHPPGVRRRRPP